MGLFISENIFDFGITEVENLFITHFMLEANEVAIKSYLLGLHALKHQLSADEISNKKIATKIGVEVEEVIQAWKYWERLGLVHIANSNQISNEFDIVYKSISKSNIEVDNYVFQNKISSQLDYYESNIENKKLAEYVESCLKRPLQALERQRLFEYVDELNIGYDLVKFAFQYSASKGKLNRRGRWNYVYTMLESWKDENIKTIEQAENYLQKRTAKYKFANEIEKITGTLGATFVFIDMIDKWKSEYEYTPAMIEIVCKFLRKTRQKLVPAYIDAYFEKIYKSNVRTKEDFATYISAGEEAYTLMKDTGLWISADEMRDAIEKWENNYGYTFEIIHQILMIYKQKNKIYKLKLKDANDSLNEAYNNGVKNIDDYNKYIKMTMELKNNIHKNDIQNKNNYSNINKKQIQFTKFNQRRDIFYTIIIRLI